jgi:hypothetical protein
MISLENIPPLSIERLPNFEAVLKIQVEKCLVSNRVSNIDEIPLSDVWNDKNVSMQVKVHGKRDKLIKWH